MGGMSIRVAAIALAATALAGCSNKQLRHTRAFQPPPASDLPAAFESAFGGPAPMSQNVGSQGGAPRVLVYRPSGFVVIAPLLVALISKGVPPAGCHDCSGGLAVSYLTRLNGGYQPVGQWYDVGPAGPAGAPPDWKLAPDLFGDPTIEADTTSVTGSCQRTLATLVELTPSGPLLRASGVVVAASNASGAGGPAAYTGVIEPDVVGHSFAVNYRGTVTGVAKWSGELIKPGVAPAPWRQTAGPALPAC